MSSSGELDGIGDVEARLLGVDTPASPMGKINLYDLISSNYSGKYFQTKMVLVGKIFLINKGK